MTVIGKYEIRPALASDVPLLPAVEHEAVQLYVESRHELGLDLGSLGRVSSEDEFRRAHGSGKLWVAADSENRPVGFALVLEIDGLAHLDEIDVHPAHGRRGLGAALLEKVCDWARAEGYPAVTLSTFRDVPWNAPFYERHGFRVVESALPPGLAALVEKETESGLRMDLRVIMRRDLTKP